MIGERINMPPVDNLVDSWLQFNGRQNQLLAGHPGQSEIRFYP